MKFLIFLSALCLSSAAFSQDETIPISTIDGTVVISATEINNGLIVTGYQGGAQNGGANTSVYGQWAKTGTIDPLNGSVEQLAQNNYGGLPGWQPMNCPYNAYGAQINNDYVLNTGSTNYGLFTGSQVGIDADLWVLISLNYPNALNQMGQYSFVLYQTDQTGAEVMLEHYDIVITAAMITGGSGSVGSGSTTGGSTTGGSTGSTGGGTTIDLTQTNSDLATLNSTEQAQTTAITNQPSNTGSFWSGLFVPQQSTVNAMTTACQQVATYGPFALFTEFLGGLESWQTGSTGTGGIGYVINFGTLPMFNMSLNVDCTPYQGPIKFCRGLLAGGLWWTAIIIFWKRVSKAI
jgi:hypothetical protein